MGFLVNVHLLPNAEAAKLLLTQPRECGFESEIESETVQRRRKKKRRDVDENANDDDYGCASQCWFIYCANKAHIARDRHAQRKRQQQQHQREAWTQTYSHIQNGTSGTKRQKHNFFDALCLFCIAYMCVWVRKNIQIATSKAGAMCYRECRAEAHTSQPASQLRNAIYERARIG